MRLLLADPIDTQPLEELKLLGVDVVTGFDLTRDTLPAALSGVGILVVRQTEVTAAAIEGARELNLIVRAGAGVGNIDVEAASARGVYVANCPGKNAAAVAELVLGMVISLDRRLVEAHGDLIAGRWERAKYATEAGLYGRRLGVVGFGPTAQEVVQRARAFGMKPSAWARSLSALRAQRHEVGYAPTLERLAATSDVLSVHLPLNAQTRGIFGRSVLEALPHGAIVINTARAELFDFAALRDVAPAKQLRLGFDVQPGEPREPTAAFASPLASFPSTLLTPHIGGSTRQAQRAIAEELVRVVRSFLTEENVPNVINVCATSPARWVVVLRQLDKVGALANTLNVLKRHGINIEEISNTVFEGARSVCTKLRVSGRPSDACLREINAFEETLHVDVFQMPNRA
jgi:D-3-phosphoglycerate dehydrogenase